MILLRQSVRRAAGPSGLRALFPSTGWQPASRPEGGSRRCSPLPGIIVRADGSGRNFTKFRNFCGRGCPRAAGCERNVSNVNVTSTPRADGSSGGGMDFQTSAPVMTPRAFIFWTTDGHGLSRMPEPEPEPEPEGMAEMGGMADAGANLA